jgi:hypothetical protein
VGRDISPQTNLEVGFTVFVISLGMIVNAFIIGSISTAITMLDARRIKRSSRIEQVTGYLRRKSVPMQLRYEIQVGEEGAVEGGRSPSVGGSAIGRAPCPLPLSLSPSGMIQDYYEYMFDSDLQDDAVLNDLPDLLRVKLELALKMTRVERIDFLRGLDSLCVLSIVRCMGSAVALPLERLMTAGQPLERMAVVTQGKASLLWQRQDDPIARLRASLAKRTVKRSVSMSDLVGDVVQVGSGVRSCGYR